jgi:hypothetical protein
MAGLLLTASACAHGTGAATDTWRAEEPAGAVQLNVTNHSGGPVEIYAVGTGTSYRLGTVLPGLTSSFVLRPGMVVNAPVEFVARSNGQSVVRSGRFMLVPGNVVDFELATTPVNSVATVRP